MRYMNRYRMRCLLIAWRQTTCHQRAKKARWQATAQHAACAALRPCFGGWQAVTQDEAAKRLHMHRSQRLLGRLRLRQALAVWRKQVGARASKQQSLANALQLWQSCLLQLSVGGWRYTTSIQQVTKAAQQRRMLACRAAAFAVWRRQAALASATAALLTEQAQLRSARLMGAAFGHWLAHAEGRRCRLRLEEMER